jgi:AcrR family transcriptional regulator
MSTSRLRAAAKSPGTRRELTRERLISAAREAIGEKGFHRATLDEIAARAGVTKGAVYDNFSSKDELFLAVVAAWTAQRSQRFSWPTVRKGSLKDRMRQLADAVLADAAEARLEAPMRAEFLLYTLTHEGIRRSIAKAGAQRFAALRERIVQFVAEDELPMPLDAFILMLEALIPGLMFIRAQAPELAGDAAIHAIFESFSAHQTRE